MATKYKAKYTGNVFNSDVEAIADNKRYLSDVNYRYTIKSRKIKQPKAYTIPFIKDKRISLTNAGLATGAVISENLLDTIAKHANAAGLPVKTAIGLTVKESTLGNPTDDRSIYKIVNSRFRKWIEEQGTRQHINTEGNDINPYMLVNFYKGDMNPYQETQVYAQNKSYDGKTFDWDKYYDLLKKGEKYADSKVKQFEQTYGDKNVLYNAFKFYKEHPDKYNPGQSNYRQLVDKRANEVWNSPQIQKWYRNYLDSTRPKYKQGGWIKNKLYNFLSNTGGINAINGGDYTGSYIYGNNPDTIPGIIYTDATLYGGKNADKTRNPLALYLGLDTIGLNKLRHDKYVLGKDTLNVDVFDGKILPIKRDKTPYKLNNKLKQEFDNLIENDKTFLINTNNYPVDSIYNKQTLDNTRSARVKPIRDKNGKYSMKLTKLWDLGGSVPGGYIADYINKFAGGKPFVLEQIMPVEFVDEYTKENYHLRQARENVGKRYKYGGSIYIKPSHRGRLTELNARTGKSEAELYNDGNPAHKKMVVFARNARKWHH